MRMIQLANAIIRCSHCSKAIASAMAWRILNQYPENLRTAAFALAQGELPEAKAGAFSLKDVMEITGLKDFEALEILYIIGEDAAAGGNLLGLLGMHDGRT